MKTRLKLMLVAVCTAALAAGGCSKRTVKKAALDAAPAAEAPQESDEIVLGTEFGLVPLLESVHFAPNMSELSEPARAALKKNAAVLKAVLAESPGVLIRVEGHCDERNTLEYNLALGQRRANSVKNYYSALGVKKGAVSTVSYGEERPVCRESYEGCWGRNRRADTALRSPSGPVKLSKKKLSAIR